MSHRNVMASPFGSTPGVEEDVDPMSSMANLADVMLVFACGLMLALVVYWNLDISPAMTEVVESEDLSEVQGDIEEGQTSMSEGKSSYEQLGVVYRDAETGKMYMLKQDAESSE